MNFGFQTKPKHIFFYHRKWSLYKLLLSLKQKVVYEKQLSKIDHRSQFRTYELSQYVGKNCLEKKYFLDLTVHKNFSVSSKRFFKCFIETISLRECIIIYAVYLLICIIR
jgi:hypothetical protein